MFAEMHFRDVNNSTRRGSQLNNYSTSPRDDIKHLILKYDIYGVFGNAAVNVAHGFLKPIVA